MNISEDDFPEYQKQKDTLIAEYEDFYEFFQQYTKSVNFIFDGDILELLVEFFDIGEEIDNLANKIEIFKQDFKQTLVATRKKEKERKQERLNEQILKTPRLAEKPQVQEKKKELQFLEKYKSHLTSVYGTGRKKTEFQEDNKKIEEAIVNLETEEYEEILEEI